MPNPVLHGKTIGGLFLIYLLLLLGVGYQFGDGDLIQLDPLILILKNHNLYQHDFYVQHAQEHFPNERSFFLLLLMPFANHLETASFLYHFLFSMLLLSALFSICRLFIKNSVLLWFALPILFIPLYNIDLGTNELYYGIFHPSLTAKALASWGFYCWLQKKYIAAYCFIALASLQHPVAGPQVFLFISATEVILIFLKKTPFKRTFWQGILIYLLTAGFFIMAIQLRFRDSAADQALFYKIFFQFRNPHHYLPQAFPLKDWLILIPLFIIGFFTWRKTDLRIFIVFCVITTGCLIYTIFADVLQNVTVASIQWFKATIWLEFLSVVACMLLLEKLFPFLAKKFWKVTMCITGGIAFLIFIFFISPGQAYMHSGKLFYNFSFSKNTPEIDISIAAKNNTPEDALFMQPCSFTDLKYYGQRSSVVDYKALTHRKSFIFEWAHRFEDVYNLHIDSAPAGLKTTAYADAQFKELTADYILQLRNKYGVTHIITYSTCLYPFEVIAENAVYKIYKLPG